MSSTHTLPSPLRGSSSSSRMAWFCKQGLYTLAGFTTNMLDSRFTQADVRPFAESILMACFRNIESGNTPEKIAENDYLMKCRLPRGASFSRTDTSSARCHACHHHGSTKPDAGLSGDSGTSRRHHRRDQQEPE